jgi:hypothetical protein
LADFQLENVALDAQTDGQFGVASFLLGWSVQDLVGVAGLQSSGDFVAFGLPGVAGFLSAFQFGFQVVSVLLAFQTDDEAVAIARVLIDRDAFLEGEFRFGFTLG